MCRGVGCLRQLTPSHLSPYVLLPPFFSICLGIHWGLWVTITAESHGSDRWESRSSLHTPKPSKRLTKKEGKRTAPCVCLCLDSRPLLCFLPSRTQLQVQASEPRAAKRYLVSRRHYLLEPWRGPCRTIENTVPGVTFITCPQK